MPITPLHYGLLAPVNHYFPGKVSLISFTLVNLWIDAGAITAVLRGNPIPAHGSSHEMGAMLIVAVLVAMPGVRSMKWTLGAFLGALSHLLLDALVHPEMQPFNWIEGNPIYLGIMEPLSIFLVPFTIWFIFQFVQHSSSLLAQYLRRKKHPDFDELKD